MVAKAVSALTDEVLDEVVGGCAIAVSGEFSFTLPNVLCVVD